MKYFSPGELATLLQQSRENIRLWSIEFAPFLTESAAPKEKGKHRSYTDADVSVLALVADYANRDIPFSEIHKALDADDRMIPASVLLNGAEPDKSLALQQRITDLEAEIADLRGKYHEVVGREKLLRELLDEANRLLRGQG